MKKSLFTTITALLLCAHLSAQKCDKFAELYGKVISDFPKVPYNKPTNDKTLFDRISYNLVADKYFLSLSKKSFLALKSKDLSKMKKRIGKCSSTEGVWQLRDYLYQVFLTPNIQKSRNNVASIKAQRSRYKKTLVDLNGTFSLQELENKEDNLNTDFSLLTQIEIEELTKAINSGKESAAIRDLLALESTINNLPNTFESLNELDSYSYKHKKLFKLAGPEAKKKVNSLVYSKEGLILISLTDVEKQKLDAIEFDVNDIKQVNRYIEDLQAKYVDYSDRFPVKSLYNHYKKKKSYFISKNAVKIADLFSNIYAERQLEDVSFDFFHNTYKTSNITKLKQFVEDRKKRLASVLNQLQKEWSKDNNIRVNLIKTNKKDASQKRVALRKKYTSHLPTFDELHYILQSYLTLIKPSGKYYLSDAESFVKLIERKGFYRKNTKNISGDIETFQNKKGYTIVCTGFASFDREDFANCSFKMPNSKDLHELYSMELTSGFKEIGRPTKNPSKVVSQKDIYANSGRTLYSLKPSKDQKLLVAQAQRNDDSKWPIMAERTSYNRLKVSSFTSTTDIYVKEGQTIKFSASGQIKIGSFAGTTTPSGTYKYKRYNRVKGFNHGALLGKIGKNGTWFLIGGNKKLVANTSGRLFLKVNDKDANNNEGHYFVNYTFESY